MSSLYKLEDIQYQHYKHLRDDKNFLPNNFHPHWTSMHLRYDNFLLWVLYRWLTI